MVDAATEFRKNGFNDDDAAQLAQIATMYQNISDESISAADSASFIISQLIAFNREASEAEGIIDAVNEVANQFSVSSGQLAQGLSIVASTSSAMGNSMEQTLGIITAISEQTRNVSKAARGANTIFARLSQVLDEGSSTGVTLRDIYEQLGIALYDAEGQLRPMYDILGDLAEVWNQLDTNTQQYIALTSAGANQLNNFLALMNNFDHAVEATNTALNSAGSAAQENERYMESLGAKVELLTAKFQDFANNVINSDLVKDVLELLSQGLDLLNTKTGQTLTQWGLLTGVLTGGITIFGQIASKIMGSITNVGKAFTSLIGITKGVSGSIGGLIKSAFPAAAVLGGIGTAIYFIYQNWKEANPTLEEATQKLEDSTSQLATNQERLEELNAIPWYDRTDEINNEIEELENLNAELEKTIELYQQQQVSAAEDIVSDRTVEVPTVQALAQANTLASNYVTTGANIISQYSSLPEAISNIIDLTGRTDLLTLSLEDQQKALEELGFEFSSFSEEAVVDASESNRLYTDSLKNMTAIVDANAASMAAGGEYVYNQVEAWEQNNAEITKVVEAYKVLQAAGEELDETALELIDAYDEWTKTAEAAQEKAIEFDRTNDQLADSYQVTMEELVALKNAYPELSDNMIVADDKAYILKGTLLDLAAAGDELAISMAKAAVETARLEAAMAKGEYGKALATYASDRSEENKEAMDAARTQMEIEQQAYEDLLNAIIQGQKDPISLDVGADVTGGSGGASSVRDQAEETKDILADLKAWLENKDHQIFLLESQQQVAEDQELLDEAERFANERAQIIQNNMAVLHNWANALRNQGYAEDSDYIKELQELWWQYKNELDNIYDDIDARREESQKAELERIDELREKQLQAREDALSKEKEAYETLANYMVDRIDEEMAAIDAEIDALDKQNDKLEDQIALEEKLDALARAKSQRVMVYKDGRFQYVSDIDAVSEAQADLDEYNREQALQAQKDALEAEKDILQQYKDEWSSLTQKYQEEQDKLLLEEYFGINAENDNWKDRLDNFQDFYDEYAAIRDALVKLQEELNQQIDNFLQAQINKVLGTAPGSAAAGAASGALAGLIATGGNPIGAILGTVLGTAGGVANAVLGSSSSGSSSSSKGSSSSSSGSGAITSDKGYTIGSGKGQSFVLDAPAGSTMTGGDGSKWTKNPDGSTTIVDKDGVKHTVSSNKRASGVLSNPTDSIDLVGEEGPEMRFNPKGAGIVPANMTKNLWAWGTINPSQYLNTISGVGANSGQSIAITIQNFNPSLPNVSNGEDFVNYLNTSFVRHVVQFTTKR